MSISGITPGSHVRTAQAVRQRLIGAVPGELRLFVRRFVALDPRARRLFVMRSARRLAHPPRVPVIPPLAGAGRVVFVCHGNILRSPFAAALLARQLVLSGVTDATIHSAGLHARDGRHADPRGIAAAADLGIDLTSHRARHLTEEIVRDADLVFVMDFANEAEFLARFPGAAHKLRMLGAYVPAGPRRSPDIADPYTMDSDAVRRCYADISRCVQVIRTAMTAAAV